MATKKRGRNSRVNKPQDPRRTIKKDSRDYLNILGKDTFVWSVVKGQRLDLSKERSDDPGGEDLNLDDKKTRIKEIKSSYGVGHRKTLSAAYFIRKIWASPEHTDFRLEIDLD